MILQKVLWSFKCFHYFFFSLTNTQRSLLFLCSHFSIASTSLCPFIFNTSSFIYRNIFVIETNPYMLETRNGSKRQLCRKSFLSENRYSFSSNHYCTLALMLFRFICLFYFIFFFIIIYSIIVLSSLREQQDYGHEGCYHGWACGCFYLALWSIIHEFVSV